MRNLPNKLSENAKFDLIFNSFRIEMANTISNLIFFVAKYMLFTNCHKRICEIPNPKIPR